MSFQITYSMQNSSKFWCIDCSELRYSIILVESLVIFVLFANATFFKIRHQYIISFYIELTERGLYLYKRVKTRNWHKISPNNIKSKVNMWLQKEWKLFKRKINKQNSCMRLELFKYINRVLKNSTIDIPTFLNLF